jgi:hypothetical protein
MKLPTKDIISIDEQIIVQSPHQWDGVVVGDRIYRRLPSAYQLPLGAS